MFRLYRMLEYIAALAGIPGLSICHQIRCIPSLNAISYDFVSRARPVHGKPTLEYYVVDELGRAVANSSKRGIGLQFGPDHALDDPILGPLSANLQPGFRRISWMPTSGLSEVTGGIVPPGTTMTLSLWVPPSASMAVAKREVTGGARRTRLSRKASPGRS
jgi:hypothetical protein